MATDREREQFLGFLRTRRLRVTRERMALFDEIFIQHGHIDAEQVLAAMKASGLKSSRATVYRNLDLLAQCGLVRKHRLGHDRFLYEHVHAGQRHDHLVCTECGRVVELVSQGIAALLVEICRAHGFVPSRHSLQIMGICKSCSEAAGEPQRVSAPGRSVHA